MNKLHSFGDIGRPLARRRYCVSSAFGEVFTTDDRETALAIAESFRTRSEYVRVMDTETREVIA